MPDANQELFDATVRHQVGLRRFAAGEVRRATKLLERADRDLLVQLRERLVSAPRGPYTTRRLEALLKDVRALRETALRGVEKAQRQTLRQLAVDEAHFEQAVLEASVPIELQLATVRAETLRALVSGSLFHGRPLQEWHRSLRQADRRRLDQQLRLGLVQGETTEQIVRRVAGTRARQFQDGALSVTRREAAAITRTAVTGVSDRARHEVWRANSDIVEVLMWAATLDGRTTPQCQMLDGGLTTVSGDPVPPEYTGWRLQPPDIRPPAHVQCRSVMVAMLSPEGVVGKRPAVTDTRTRSKREVDFRKIAKAEGKPIQQVRKEWAERNVGRVPADTTYEQWLGKQPKAFQDEVLGPTRAEMWRSGQIKNLRQFVDASGKKLTLDELRRELPEVRAERSAPSFPGRRTATKEDFDRISHSNVDDEMLEVWNRRINMDPEEFLENVLQVEAQGLKLSRDRTIFKAVEGSDHDMVRFSVDLERNGEKIGTLARELRFGKSTVKDYTGGRYNTLEEVPENLRHFLSDAVSNTVYHDYFELVRTATGSGLGKNILRSSVDMWRHLGMKQVTLTANIDVGGYAWARYGFKPRADAWKDLKRTVRDRVPDGISEESRAVVDAALESEDPRAIWSLADLREDVDGQSLGKRLLLDTKWAGELDLEDAQAVQRFEAYVS